MKILLVVAVLATVLMPARGVLRQCAGTGPDRKYESSGFLTADWTKNACNAAGGKLDPTRLGNQKCCTVLDDPGRQLSFNGFCKNQKHDNYPTFNPTAQPC
ncbi:hypothetical protein PHMEG_00025288 [Phytophthora megakarya]|uniref:Secreted protein n=1 Tax=Phytophthora megakarya TaxID=4795 RepID=A0A225VEY1_9STRA|nr:hypothetical protein PHMEG_00025288 [Phytophthora megakarya]